MVKLCLYQYMVKLCNMIIRYNCVTHKTKKSVTYTSALARILGLNQNDKIPAVGVAGNTALVHM